MAINKDVENEYGAKFNYHKLREIRVINDDKIGIQLVMNVYSWVNKQARIEGKAPTIRQCIIDNADFAMTPFYALLKAKFPDFATGEDDFDDSFKQPHDGVVEFVQQTQHGDLINRWEEAGSQPAQEE